MLLAPFDRHIAPIEVHFLGSEPVMVRSFDDLVREVSRTKTLGSLWFRDTYAGEDQRHSVDPAGAREIAAKWIQSTVMSRCLTGDCWLFALLAAERIENDGFVAAVSDDEDIKTHHVGLKLKNGQILDVRGITALEKFKGYASIIELDEVQLLRRWRREGAFPASMDPRDDMALNGRIRFAVEAVAALEEIETEPFAPSPKEEALIIVHPGSMCGSADMNIGKDLARASREDVIRDIKNWTGDIVVIDSFLSDELKGTSLGIALEEAICSARAAGKMGHRVFGCDNLEPSIEDGVKQVVAGLQLENLDRVSLTGAWYDPDDESGCVNEVRRLLNFHGVVCDVLDSAVSLDDDPDTSFGI